MGTGDDMRFRSGPVEQISARWLMAAGAIVILAIAAYTQRDSCGAIADLVRTVFDAFVD